MCIIIDTNCLSSVFKTKATNHKEFEPVYDWILKGNGFIVLGGSKYMSELKRCPEILRIICQLRLKCNNKVLTLDQNLVDIEQKKIESLIADPDFDDPHLPAMVIVSKCQLICSLDTRSVRFVQCRKLYPNDVKTPKFYTGKRNRKLLCNKYIDNRYKKKYK